MTIYLHDWAERGEDGMLADFGITRETIAGATIIIASYTYEDYSGSAFVLFQKEGKLFEVHGSHCSCYGLSEGDYSGGATTQWQPEETSAEAVRHRLTIGTWGEEDKIKDAILAALDALAQPVAANDNISKAGLNDVPKFHDTVADINAFVALTHGASSAAGWWNEPGTGVDLRTNPYVIGTKIGLIHSEISEAMEGHRKGAMDDHLTHRKSIEVELADAMIRIGDMAGVLGLDLGGAIVEKMAYNARRADHKMDNRAAAGGKVY